MEAPDWEAETYKRLLMVIGAQETDEQMARAKQLLRDFNHFFPNAKGKWDEFCRSLGVNV